MVRKQRYSRFRQVPRLLWLAVRKHDVAFISDWPRNNNSAQTEGKIVPGGISAGNKAVVPGGSPKTIRL